MSAPQHEPHCPGDVPRADEPVDLLEGEDGVAGVVAEDAVDAEGCVALPGQQGLEPADAWPHRSLTERRELHRDPEAADDRRVARRRHESDARQVAQPPGRGQPRAEAAVRALTYMERDSLVSHDEMDLARLPRRDTARQRQDRPDRARAGDGQLHQRLHDDGDGRRLDGAVLDEEGSRRPRRRREGERAVGRRRRRSEQGPGRTVSPAAAGEIEPVKWTTEL